MSNESSTKHYIYCPTLQLIQLIEFKLAKLTSVFNNHQKLNKGMSSRPSLMQIDAQRENSHNSTAKTLHHKKNNVVGYFDQWWEPSDLNCMKNVTFKSIPTDTHLVQIGPDR